MSSDWQPPPLPVCATSVAALQSVPAVGLCSLPICAAGNGTNQFAVCTFSLLSPDAITTNSADLMWGLPGGCGSWGRRLSPAHVLLLGLRDGLPITVLQLCMSTQYVISTCYQSKLGYNNNKVKPRIVCGPDMGGTMVAAGRVKGLGLESDKGCLR